MSSFKTLDQEMWLAKRAKAHGIFVGLTSREERMQRFREALTPYAALVCGRNAAGKPETYAQVFQRIYGEPLIPTPKGHAGHTERRALQEPPGETE